MLICWLRGLAIGAQLGDLGIDRRRTVWSSRWSDGSDSRLLSMPSCALICLVTSCSPRTRAASAGSLATTRALESASACSHRMAADRVGKPEGLDRDIIRRVRAARQHANIGFDDSLQARAARGDQRSGHRPRRSPALAVIRTGMAALNSRMASASRPART